MTIYPTLHSVKSAPGARFWALSWYQPMSLSKRGISCHSPAVPTVKAQCTVQGFCGPCRRELDCECVG